MFSGGDRSSSAATAQRPKGLYMFGGVGVGEQPQPLFSAIAYDGEVKSQSAILAIVPSRRNLTHGSPAVPAGKTMLMDLLVQSSPPEFKVRVGRPGCMTGFYKDCTWHTCAPVVSTPP